MATFNFVKTTPDGVLAPKVKVTNASLPVDGQGTLLKTFYQPPNLNVLATAEVTSTSSVTTQPSTANLQFIPWTSSAFTYGGKPVVVSGRDQAAGYNFGLNGWTGNVIGDTSCTIEFYMTGSTLVLNFANTANTQAAATNPDWRMTIDETPFTKNLYSSDVTVTGQTHNLWQHEPNFTSANTYLIFNFPNTRTRKIRFWVPSQVGFKGAWVANTNLGGGIYKTPKRFKCLIVGDSYVSGVIGASQEGSIFSGAIAGSLAYYAGWDVWNLGIQGTGYQNNGGGSPAPGEYGAANRLSAIQACGDADLVITYGGGNDGNPSSYPLATTSTKCTAYWTALKAQRPNTPIIVIGVQPAIFDTTQQNNLNQTIKGAALAHPGVTAYIDMRQGPTGQWITGTGRTNNRTGQGNADMFVCSDAVHLAHGGYEYLVRRALVEMGKVRI